MPRRKKNPTEELRLHLSELDRRYNVIDQKLDAIAHVRVNGSVGIEPALMTLYEYAKANKASIEQIKEETQLMRDMHKGYLLYKKYALLRFIVKVVALLAVGQLVGLSIVDLAKLFK